MGLFWMRIDLWRIRRAIQALQTAIENHSKATSASNQSKRNDPTIPPSINAIITFDNQTKRDAKTENDRQYTVQNSIRCAAWFAFGAAFLYAGISAYQTYLLRKQIRNSVESFRMDERAWVELEPIVATPISPPDKEFPAGFSCGIYPKNVGRTVATNISVKAVPALRTGEFSPKEMQSLQDMLQTAKNYTVNIGPDKTTQSVTDRFPSNPVPKVLSPNTISNAPFRISCQATKDYTGGSHAYTFVVGRIDYCDAFSIRHWKTSCFYVANARGDVWNCQEGNDEDRYTEDPMPQSKCESAN